MSDQIVVDPQRALDHLMSDPLGAALWRLAVAEAKSEILTERIAELERQKAPAALPRTTPERREAEPSVVPEPRSDLAP